MAENPTTSELLKAEAISEDNVQAAVGAYMADPSAQSVDLSGYTLDLQAAIAASVLAKDLLSKPLTDEYLKDKERHDVHRHEGKPELVLRDPCSEAAGRGDHDALVCSVRLDPAVDIRSEVQAIPERSLDPAARVPEVRFTHEPIEVGLSANGMER